MTSEKDRLPVEETEFEKPEDGYEKGFETSSSEIDMVELEAHDDVLTRKMKLINDAIDEIGFTWYHLKLAFLP